MADATSADLAENGKKAAASNTTPRLQVKVSVSSNTCNRLRDIPFKATVELINLEEVPVTLHRERDNQVFKLPGALHDHTRPFVFRHLATGKEMSMSTHDICYMFNDNKPTIEHFFTIPPKGIWQYSGQLNTWTGPDKGDTEVSAYLGPNLFDPLHSLEAGEMYQFMVKEGLKIAWWEYGEQNEIYDVVMWEIAQGGQPKKPKPVVLKVVRGDQDTFTMVD